MQSLLVSLLLFTHTVAAVQEGVNLGYALYRGQALGNGVTQWLGMRYAHPPVGQLRFAAPQDPVEESGTVLAQAYGPTCISTWSVLKAGDHSPSEDCLFVNIFAPTTALDTSKLAVFVYINGGGFNGASQGPNGTNLVLTSNLNIVVVSFAYRVGPYGFLAAADVRENQTGSLNNGLKDQRKLLQWVQKYISRFGGDPNHVTLGGASAGAGSVVLQITAMGGQNDNLIHAAAAESQAFPALYTPEESQFLYDDLVAGAGCTSTKDSFQCLKYLNILDLQKSVYRLYMKKVPFPGAKSAPVYHWQPTFDRDFIQNYTYLDIKNGRFLDIPVIFGDDTNEGRTFTPNNIKDIQSSNDFLRNNYPALTGDHLKTLQDLYPKGPQLPGFSAYFTRTASLYGDLRYICGGFYITDAYDNRGRTNNYFYRWDVGKADHTAENGVVFNGGTGNSAYIHRYWVSFILNFDPNEFKHPNAPKWEPWGSKKGFRRLWFGNNSRIGMETISNWRRRQCDYVNNISVALKK